MRRHRQTRVWVTSPKIPKYSIQPMGHDTSTFLRPGFVAPFSHHQHNNKIVNMSKNISPSIYPGRLPVRLLPHSGDATCASLQPQGRSPRTFLHTTKASGAASTTSSRPQTLALRPTPRPRRPPSASAPNRPRLGSDAAGNLAIPDADFSSDSSRTRATRPAPPCGRKADLRGRPATTLCRLAPRPGRAAPHSRRARGRKNLVLRPAPPSPPPPLPPTHPPLSCELRPPGLMTSVSTPKIKLRLTRLSLSINHTVQDQSHTATPRASGPDAAGGLATLTIGVSSDPSRTWATRPAPPCGRKADLRLAPRTTFRQPAPRPGRVAPHPRRACGRKPCTAPGSPF